MMPTMQPLFLVRPLFLLFPYLFPHVFLRKTKSRNNCFPTRLVAHFVILTLPTAC